MRPARGSEGACGWSVGPWRGLVNVRRGFYRALEGLLGAPQSVRDPVRAFWGPVGPWRSLGGGACRGLEGLLGPHSLERSCRSLWVPIGPRRNLKDLMWALEGLLGVLECLGGTL